MRNLWRRFKCRLALHSFEWRYNEDRSERWRACRYCGRDGTVGVHPVIG